MPPAPTSGLCNKRIPLTFSGGRSAGSTFCRQYHLSESSLEAIRAGRGDYASILCDLGFVTRAAAIAAAARQSGSEMKYASWMSQPVNKNASNARFLKSAVCAGFYPAALRVQVCAGLGFRASYPDVVTCRRVQLPPCNQFCNIVRAVWIFLQACREACDPILCA